MEAEQHAAEYHALAIVKSAALNAGVCVCLFKLWFSLDI